MTRTVGPLTIGYKNGSGYAYPDPYEIDNGDNVPVVPETRCRVWFVKRADVFFLYKDHEARETVWICNGSDVTPQYVVVPHRGRRPKAPLNTYSIKVGSGGIHRKSKSKAKGKTKGKTKGENRRKDL